MADLRRAEAEARELLRVHGVQQPPVDVQSIAEHEGIRIRFTEMQDGVSGVLVQRGGSIVIGINSAHHAHRQRFTLAHELGHYRLHSEGPTVYVDQAMVHFRSDVPATAAEVEANTFAAALLMPEEFVRTELQGRPVDAFDDDAVRRLSQRYKVSPQALTIRLMELGLIGGLGGR
jgi:Zn-dependent peptidase ImmA (M78 family)